MDASAHLMPTGPKFKNLTGRRFGRWTVVEFAGFTAGKSHATKWRCVCTCGGRGDVVGAKLTSGWSQSCGCLKAELSAERRTTHGWSGHPLYDVWYMMIDRCHNPENPGFYLYGARGISVCDRWRESFANFLADMGERPFPKAELDRFPDMNGNYAPGNVRWATRTQQNRNTRRNRRVEFQGELRTFGECAEATGICHETIRSRIARGIPVNDAATTPVKPKLSDEQVRDIFARRRTGATYQAIADATGIAFSTVYAIATGRRRGEAVRDHDGSAIVGELVL